MLTINTLGKFQMMEDGAVLNEDNIRSSMLMKLLAYLLLHRDQAVSTDELSEALWHEDETDNPLGALKNLTYRLRNVLTKNFGEQKYIITNRGSYRWNPDLDILLDVEQFETYMDLASDETKIIGERISYYEQALDIYQGEFMGRIEDLHWVVTQSGYYHSMFLSGVKTLADLYVKRNMFSELEVLCVKALSIDNVDEKLYYYLILARVRSNHAKLAMETYEEACDILYKELGIRQPKGLEEIYQELLAMSHGEEASNIEDAQEDMVEETVDGVFVCGYPVFRAIYQLEARRIARMGWAEYVVLLTLEPKGYQEGEYSQMERAYLIQGMNKMDKTIKKALRSGDVTSKYSEFQYIMMLPNCNYESALLVVNRILSSFYTSCKNVNVKVNLEEVGSTSIVKERKL